MKLPFNVPFREAADFFKSKIPLTRDEFDQLSDEVKVRAFTVATVTKAEILQDMLDAVKLAIDSGLTLGDLSTDEILGIAGWGGLTPWHTETVFRTNIQSAYGRGRWEQQRQQQDDFPYLRYRSVLDSRTRPSHRALDGAVFAIGDPVLKRIYPPWDYNCRCWMEQLTADEAEAIGVTPVNILDDGSSDFTSPAADFDWTPDLSGLDSVLRAKVEQALSEFKPSDRAE